MSGPGDPIGAHLAALPQPQRDTLTALRMTLRDLLPDAEECLSYGMPCFKAKGVAVAGFDGFRRHCSYFPHSGNVLTTVSGIPPWCTVAAKGTLQFPVDRPLPKHVVRRLVRARLAEIAERGAGRRSR
ncbi:MAG: iron chaperone [Gaiella sp.]